MPHPTSAADQLQATSMASSLVGEMLSDHEGSTESLNAWWDSLKAQPELRESALLHALSEAFVEQESVRQQVFSLPHWVAQGELPYPESLVQAREVFDGWFASWFQEHASSGAISEPWPLIEKALMLGGSPTYQAIAHHMGSAFPMALASRPFVAEDWGLHPAGSNLTKTWNRLNRHPKHAFVPTLNAYLSSASRFSWLEWATHQEQLPWRRLWWSSLASLGWDKVEAQIQEALPQGRPPHRLWASMRLAVRSHEVLEDLEHARVPHVEITPNNSANQAELLQAWSQSWRWTDYRFGACRDALKAHLKRHVAACRKALRVKPNAETDHPWEDIAQQAVDRLLGIVREHLAANALPMTDVAWSGELDSTLSVCQRAPEDPEVMRRLWRPLLKMLVEAPTSHHMRSLALLWSIAGDWNSKMRASHAAHGTEPEDRLHALYLAEMRVLRSLKSKFPSMQKKAKMRRSDPKAIIVPPLEVEQHAKLWFESFEKVKELRAQFSDASSPSPQDDSVVAKTSSLEQGLPPWMLLQVLGRDDSLGILAHERLRCGMEWMQALVEQPRAFDHPAAVVLEGVLLLTSAQSALMRGSDGVPQEAPSFMDLLLRWYGRCSPEEQGWLDQIMEGFIQQGMSIPPNGVQPTLDVLTLFVSERYAIMKNEHKLGQAWGRGSDGSVDESPTPKIPKSRF